MLLTHTHIKMFKSIEDSGEVCIDPSVTVLVGQNESGKTAYLQALHKARAIESHVHFDAIEDYPRRALTVYERRGEPAVVVVLTYQMQKNELEKVNSDLGCKLLEQLSFTIRYKYDGTYSFTLQISEEPYITHLIENADLPAEVRLQASQAKTVREMISLLEALDLNTEATNFLNDLRGRFHTASTTSSDLLTQHIWEKYIYPNIPKFLYFDEYNLLPGKINLPQLQQRVQSNQLQPEDRTVLGLLQIAGVELSALMNTENYEQGRAKLEAISNAITDRVFEYWTQNRELEVLFDIKSDAQEQAPFNNGNNLYIRIRNQRHRVSVPFNLRSRGFIWFFSFMAWFDSIKQHLNANDDLILLLDEPGLSLHALAQADFLRYIDELAKRYQILYTTHSPFMVHSDRLYQVRTVEDQLGHGTRISDNVTGSDAKTCSLTQLLAKTGRYATEGENGEDMGQLGT